MDEFHFTSKMAAFNHVQETLAEVWDIHVSKADFEQFSERGWKVPHKNYEGIVTQPNVYESIDEIEYKDDTEE